MVVAAAGLLGLAAFGTTSGTVAAMLAVVGVGLGLFIAPNNAGVMAAAPAEQSGLASGLLNMGRGMGTALGLAVTATVFAALGGDGAAVGAVRSAFAGTLLALAGFALAGAAIAWAGTGHPPIRGKPPGPGTTGS